MNAAWWPFSTTTTIDSSATIVLPEPTSPCTSRFIGCGEPQVVGDLAQDAPLRAGERERQDALDGLASGVRHLECLPLALRAHAAAAPGEAELEQQQLLQDQPHVAGRAEAVERVEAVVVAGQVHAPQRLGAADDAEPRAQLRRQRVGQVGGNLRPRAVRARAAAA